MTKEAPKPELKPKPIAYAFIDAQNMHIATSTADWEVSFKKLYTHLKETYGVTKSYMFFGYLERNKRLYEKIEKAGFEVIFQDVTVLPDGSIKGNVDVNLTIYAVCDMRHYEKAVLITADGDFEPLVKFLNRFAKHTTVISPAQNLETSAILRRAAGGNFVSMEQIKDKICR